MLRLSFTYKTGLLSWGTSLTPYWCCQMCPPCPLSRWKSRRLNLVTVKLLASLVLASGHPGASWVQLMVGQHSRPRVGNSLTGHRVSGNTSQSRMSTENPWSNRLKRFNALFKKWPCACRAVLILCYVSVLPDMYQFCLNLFFFPSPHSSQRGLGVRYWPAHR